MKMNQVQRDISPVWGAVYKPGANPIGASGKRACKLHPYLRDDSPIHLFLFILWPL